MRPRMARLAGERFSALSPLRLDVDTCPGRQRDDRHGPAGPAVTDLRGRQMRLEVSY